jgi:hypothetical protein
MLATSKVVKRKIYRLTIDKIDHNGKWGAANPLKGGAWRYRGMGLGPRLRALLSGIILLTKSGGVAGIG